MGLSNSGVFTFSRDRSGIEKCRSFSFKVFVLETIAGLLPTRNVAGDEAFVISEPDMWNTSPTSEE